MNAIRVSAITMNVFREVIRDRVLYLIGFYGLLLAGAVRILPEISGSLENKVLLDLGLAAMTFLGLIIAIFVGTGLVSKEIEKRTVFVLIAKPISRAEFILGKHLGLSAVLAVLLGSMTLIYLGVLGLSRIQYPLGSILISILYTFLELSLIAAVAILFSVFTGSLLATMITFAVFLIGRFSADLADLKITNPDLQRLIDGVYLVLPDLSRLNIKDAVYGVIPDVTTLLMNATYGLIYIVLVLTIATIVFSRREF